ncbi:MAG TPA: mechanosensitive ion channel family protein [Methylomirabilota bacterium]|nr:mechanosensitive ion channel family protein [Methylomirabilota bacterium]
MLELPDFSPAAETALRLLLIITAALVAFLVGRMGIRISMRHLVERRSSEAGAAVLPPAELERRLNTVGNLAVRVIGVLIVIIAVLMALDLFGIDIGPAIAGLGVVGIAVGLGAQSLIKDWLAGIFVVLENQYSQGDVVSIAGVTGVVEDFSLRRTTLRSLDGTLHSVPNGEIMVASNLTRLWARVNLDVSVAYGTDIDRATEVIRVIGEELMADEQWGSRLIEAPAVARVEALADSAVELKVLGQVHAGEQWAVTGELRRRILDAFGAAGIEIPFPHQVSINRGEPHWSQADEGTASD